jgi:hypothetical protein
MKKIIFFTILLTLFVITPCTGEILDQAVLRSGCVIGSVDIPDTLVPGETYQITWMVQSYVDIRSRFQIRYDDGTKDESEGDLLDTREGTYSISDRKSYEYYFSVPYTVPLDKTGDARVGFHNSQTDGDYWMYGLFPTGVIDRPYGTAGKQFYVTISPAQTDPAGKLDITGANAKWEDNYDPMKAIDGDISTGYHSAYTHDFDRDPNMWWEADLGTVRSVSRIKLYWQAVIDWKEIEITGSRDGTTYSTLVDRTRVNVDGSWTEFDVTGTYRFLRLLYVGSGAGGHGLDLMEFEVYADQNPDTGGQYLFYEDFEGNDNGQTPAGWTFNSIWGDTGTIRIVDNPVSEGRRGVKVKGNSGWCQGIYSPGSLYQGNQIIRFDVNVPSGNEAGQSPGYFTYAGGINLTFYATGSDTFEVRLRHNEILIPDLETDQWHTLELEVDWDNSAFRITCNGITSSAEFEKNTDGRWASDISLYGNNSSVTNTVFFDRIVIYEEGITAP